MEDDKKKWVLFAVFAAFVVGLLVVMVIMVFKPSKPSAPEASVTVVIPDGDAVALEESKSKVYRGSTENYYEGLSAKLEAEEDISLVSSTPASGTAVVATVAERPEAAAERVFGTGASDSPAPSSAEPRRSGAARALSEDERLEYDRKRAEMVKEVLTGASADEMPDQVGQDDGRVGQDSPASIDLSAVGSSDGIITTLDDEPSEGVGYGIRPFRCMFVRDQKIKSGQRVTVRLLEDYVHGALRIPANTHLSAICKIGERLELSVRSLEMNGRIVPLALDAYDTDGLQGIYCPETSASKNSRQASNDAISAAGTTFGGLVGDLASTVLRTGASIARSASGEVSVNVVSGYEFYLVKSERK